HLNCSQRRQTQQLWASGPRSQRASPAVIGTSTPATATTVVCSSPLRPGQASVAPSTHRPLTKPRRPSRSRSPRRCWLARELEHGRTAAAPSPKGLRTSRGDRPSATGNSSPAVSPQPPCGRGFAVSVGGCSKNPIQAASEQDHELENQGILPP